MPIPRFGNIWDYKSPLNKTGPADAVRFLPESTEQIRDEMLNMAISYNVNIICGSMLEYKDHNLYNVSYLCRRDGPIDSQYKLHITPDESSYGGM